MYLREKLGLTQPEFAHYLKITRSQLAMYEKGGRRLPSAALRKLSELEIVVQNLQKRKTKPEPEHLKTQAAYAQKKLNRQVKVHHVKAVRKELQLAATQTKYDRHSLLLEVLDSIKDDPTDPADELWLRTTRDKAQSSIDKNGLHAQYLLELQMEGHLHMHNLAKEKHDALEKLK